MNQLYCIGHLQMCLHLQIHLQIQKNPAQLYVTQLRHRIFLQSKSELFPRKVFLTGIWGAAIIRTAFQFTKYSCLERRAPIYSLSHWCIAPCDTRQWNANLVKGGQFYLWKGRLGLFFIAAHQGFHVSILPYRRGWEEAFFPPYHCYMMAIFLQGIFFGLWGKLSNKQTPHQMQSSSRTVLTM